MAPLVGKARGLRHFASTKKNGSALLLRLEETMFLCNSNSVARGPNLSPKGEKSFFLGAVFQRTFRSAHKYNNVF